MPRPVWSGTISFGLVTIPVKLFHAVSRKNVSFNQLDDRSMSRIRMKKVSAETGEDVPDEHIVCPFTPPLALPVTSHLWMKLNRMMLGMATRIDIAAS